MRASILESLSPIAAARLAVGLGQGVLLYLLFQAAESNAWPASEGLLFAPLLVVAWFLPLIVLVGLGNMRLRPLVLWTTCAAALLIGLAVHDFDRAAEDSKWFFSDQNARIWPSMSLMVSVALGLFIAQSLIVAGDADRKFIATYPRYFDAAWKHGVQLALAVVFVGVFWILLWLGAGLFKLIEIDFFIRLISHRWFIFPATTLALAGAIHVTDVRAGIVRGMRTLIHVLLSWLLPLMTLFAVGFLASLPFTGLSALWSTRFATSLLLTTAAALVLLINATYQDGESQHSQPRVLRHAASLAALTLVPLVAIAAYALALRVEQHGWTSDRIIAAACLIVAASSALGYAWAVVRPGAWLKRLEACNVATAFVILVVLLALLTPVADPARIAVASQVARLKSGKIAPEQFDFAFLRFDGARYGRAALEKFKTTDEGTNAAYIRERAEAALKLGSRWPRAVVPPMPQDIAGNITVHPENHPLPEAFVRQDWTSFQSHSWLLPQCLTNQSAKCEAFFADLDADGVDEIVLIDVAPAVRAAVFKANSDGTWRMIGTLSGQIWCTGVREALRAGDFKVVPSPWHDLDVNGQRLWLQLQTNDDRKCSP